MQQEAELEQSDVIIPWPLVAAAALFVAFGVLQALLAGRGATPLDRVFVAPSPAGMPLVFNPYDDLRTSLVARLSHDFMSPAFTSSISGIVLMCAFVDRGISTKLLLGGFPGGAPRRARLLNQAEILIGITVVLWFVQVSAKFALRPGAVFDQAVPNELAVLP